MNRVACINQSELHQSIEWIIFIMIWRASVYAILNSNIVVDIYQLMKLLVGQAVVDLSMSECKCALIPLASSSWCTLRNKSQCKLMRRRCRVTKHLPPCSWKWYEHNTSFEVNTSVAMNWNWKGCIPDDVLPSTVIFWVRGLEKEPPFSGWGGLRNDMN
jgi:hypothetical protein